MRRHWWCVGILSLALSATACRISGDGPPGTLVTGPVNLLYISESSGWGVAEIYSSLIQKWLGVPVNVIDWREGGLSLKDAVAHIDRDLATIAAADIVVLEGNPYGSGVREGFGECMNKFATKSPGPYTVQDFAPYQALMEEALAKITTARAGKPTAIRVTDIYNAAPDMWVKLGLDADCRSIWDAQHEAISQAAATGGARFVSAYDVFNGPNHDQSPGKKGYLTSDGIHPSSIGADAMAVALDAAGYAELTGK